MQPDELDLKLMHTLTRNARLSLVELSERVGLSTTACARRLRALEEAGLVAGYQTLLDLKALGLGATVLVRIALDSQSEEALNTFERAVLACPSVVKCYLMSGSDDYLLTVLAGDIADYERIHKTQLSRLPGVARIQSSFALREIVDRPVPLDFPVLRR